MLNAFRLGPDGRKSFLSVLLFSCVMSCSASVLSVIPEPVSVTEVSSDFLVDSETKVSFSQRDSDANSVAELFSRAVAENTGITLTVGENLAGKVIRFSLNTQSDPQLGDEGYKLDVTPTGVEIHANKPAGLFYGGQTLIQMIPLVDKADRKSPSTSVSVPGAKIVDYPRFVWRGLMLDVSRRFLSKEFVMRFIDQMSRYKFNTLHWHLTDDDGWRIEIKSLPKLTEIGAWRVPRTGKYGYFASVGPEEAPTEGGFYTQEDIREIVAYAAERFVTVVPEIDLPGHSSTFIASYPEVSCTGQQFPTYSGTRGDLKDDVICVGNAENFGILDKVFTEIAALFPSQYVHIGGDEVNPALWNQCPKCKDLMQAQTQKDPHGLQAYFTKKMSEMLAAKGKKMVGWDEILEGDIPKESVVMAWQSSEKGAEAAQKGHPVVMSPIIPYYLDHIQGDPAIEQYGGYLLRPMRLSQVYEYEPVPEGVDPKLILGAQGNVWTNRMGSERHVEYMTWPRALALAEVLWSPKRDRDWSDFANRVEAQFPRFRLARVNIAPSMYDPFITPSRDASGNLLLTFSTEKPGLDVYYTFDYTFPDDFAAKVGSAPVEVPKGAEDVWAISYRGGQPVGRLLKVSLRSLERRL